MTKTIYQHENVPFLLLYIYDSEINSHYLKRYIKFIRHFKSIEPKEKRKKGFEKHHIFPNNSCSKKFSVFENNLVLLPLRAHYIVHWLLWKAFPKNKAMMFAFNQMAGRVKNKGIRLNSRVYEKLRNEFVEISSKIARETNRKRVEDRSHNLLGPESNRKRVKNGTHNFLGGGIQRESNRKRVKNGTHNFLGKGNLSVFDIELEKIVRIPKELYYSNKIRYLHLRSKVYKELKQKS
ncbi:MAG: hypothetical protein KC550_05130 [Nanoarchaeota archaeon]|nr:hypothetical protein [Nanoarchaeota archaeon]